jgi:hypothetical protein
MPTLTSDQIAAVRAQTGDRISPYDVSDAQLQALYDDPNAAGGDLDRLTVFALRRRLGAASSLIALGAGIDAAYQQRFAHLTALLAYWEQKTGLDGGSLASGALSLGLDEEVTP